MTLKLKNGQRVLAWVTVCDDEPMKAGRIFCETAHESFYVDRADLIAPDDPSLGPWAGWVLDRGYKSDTHEGVVLSRPLAPPWKPEVGQRAWWRDKNVAVLAIDEGSAWVRLPFSGRAVVSLADLSPPRPEGDAP